KNLRSLSRSCGIFESGCSVSSAAVACRDRFHPPRHEARCIGGDARFTVHTTMHDAHNDAQRARIGDGRPGAMQRFESAFFSRCPGVAAARKCSSECPRSGLDRKSTRLNSSHVKISYAVFCLKKKTT